ncbi:MAG: Rrf2 family transcriptional regulator [Phycisphaeraceae bacterium]|nr:Rrf2 family transcriptional regulator [Phycisphaeraceae bacterium]
MFSQTTEYALRAMAWLALSPDTLTPTGQLAEKTKVPTHYLSKVLQQLGDAKLISGRRGVKGGYRLARHPSQITLLEVVNAVSEVKRITSCPLGLANHGPNLCPLHRRIDAVAAATIEIYGNTTLESLLLEPNAPKPLCDTEMTAKLSIGGVPIGTRG